MHTTVAQHRLEESLDEETAKRPDGSSKSAATLANTTTKLWCDAQEKSNTNTRRQKHYNNGQCLEHRQPISFKIAFSTHLAQSYINIKSLTLSPISQPITVL